MSFDFVGEDGGDFGISLFEWFLQNLKFISSTSIQSKNRKSSRGRVLEGMITSIIGGTAANILVEEAKVLMVKKFGMRKLLLTSMTFILPHYNCNCLLGAEIQIATAPLILHQSSREWRIGGSPFRLGPIKAEETEF